MKPRYPSPIGRLAPQSEPNIQNTPIRTPEGRAIRAAFVEPIKNTVPRSPNPTFIPSAFQSAIFNFVKTGRGNCFVRATAGSGKTTTGIEASKFMVHRGKPEYEKFHSVAFVSFNKPIAREIDGKIKALVEAGVPLKYVRVGTFHSFGYKAWIKVYPECADNVCLNDEKMDAMHEALAVPLHLRPLVEKLISFAKNDAVMLDWQTDNIDRWARIIDRFELDSEIEDPEEMESAIKIASKGLLWHKEDGIRRIDFDDMLWLPVITDVKVWQHTWVIVDEAQDSNAVRRHMARKMGNRWTRYMFVGDADQAINAFTGADTDAVDRIIRDFQCTELPLTVTYRCPLAVVEKAREYVGDRIQARPGAPRGEVTDLPARDFKKFWMVPGQFQPDDLILCRKTAPLISLCFQLIRKNIPARVEGRDIGKGLIALARRWKLKSINALKDRLVAWRDKEMAKLKAKKKEAAAEALADRVECLLALTEGCDTIDALVQRINTMFEDSNGEERKTLTLMTVHKSKGAEANRVFILGFRDYMPSKAARQPEDVQQEINLMFVAVTRAKQELYLVQALD